MDVVDVTEEMTLNDVEVRHIIPVSSSKATIGYVCVFIDKQANTYYTLSRTGLPFVEGNVYDIHCKYNPKNKRLTYIEIMKLKKISNPNSVHNLKSEQAKHPDAEDVLLGLADYKNNKSNI